MKNHIHLLPWEMEAIEHFEHMMKKKKKPFPCIPAAQGFSLNHFCFGFVSALTNDKTIIDVAAMLKEYTFISSKQGDFTSLIIFLKSEKENGVAYTVPQYECLFWQLLNSLHVLDSSPWPKDIPKDPHHPLWEFCFENERYFVFCATPAHVYRKSRFFPFFMLAITPRWVLQRFERHHQHAAKIKQAIRKRIEKYDHLPPHPDLNQYGDKNNFEWKQYFIHDDDTTLNKCPFHPK